MLALSIRPATRWLCWETTANASPAMKFPDLGGKYWELRAKLPSPLGQPLEARNSFGKFPAIGTGKFVANRESRCEPDVCFLAKADVPDLTLAKPMTSTAQPSKVLECACTSTGKRI